MRQPTAELPPDSRSLVGSQYDQPDYQDRFVTDVRAGRYRNVDEVVNDCFTKQPTWLRLLSTNTFSKKGVEAAIAGGGYEPDSAVGSWIVIERNHEEIVFGDDMGFMEYRFSMRLDPEDPSYVEASTAVRYKWRRTGRFYFAAVRPMHKRFVVMSMRSAVSDNSQA